MKTGLLENKLANGQKRLTKMLSLRAPKENKVIRRTKIGNKYEVTNTLPPKNGLSGALGAEKGPDTASTTPVFTTHFPTLLQKVPHKSVVIR